MSKVYLLYRSTNQHNDQLLSVHGTKASAIAMKVKLSSCRVRGSKVSEIYDLYIVEKYVIE